MKQSNWREYSLSRMMLGTVQFGMPYGVANRTGQPTFQEVLAIVKAALDGGVNCFDTAASYGASEEVLGRALTELGVTNQVVVVTKVSPVMSDKPTASKGQVSSEEPLSAENAFDVIERSVAESRSRLRMERLPVVLFHREVDSVYLDQLERLRRRGWLNHFGVSCDNRTGAAGRLVASGQVAALQLPANVVDRRHERSGVFQEASDQNVAVFIRSAYLQGLLVMPDDQIPMHLAAIRPMRQKLAGVADQAGVPLRELALRYLLSLPGVASVLVGVETVSQVRDNVAMFDRGPLDATTVEAIHQLDFDPPEKLITPSMWEQSRPAT